MVDVGQLGSRLTRVGFNEGEAGGRVVPPRRSLLPVAAGNHVKAAPGNHCIEAVVVQL